MSFTRQIYDTLKGNRNIQLLTLQAVITQFCFAMFNVIWQPYMLNLNTTYTQLGLLQSIITGATGIGALIWGRLSDNIGRKPAHIGSILCRVIAVGFVFTANDWTGFIGFALFMGLSSSWSHTNPVTTTLVSESVTEDKMSTSLSIYSSAGTLISVLAAPLGGYIAVNQGYYIIFLTCIVGELVNTILASVFLRETLDTEQLRNGKPLDLRTLLVPEKEVLPFYIISILVMFSWRIAFINLNAILVDQYQITPIQLGLMASTFSVTWGLTQAPIGALMDKHPKKRFLLIGRAIFILIPLGYLLSRSFTIFMLLQVVNGIGHSLSIPSTTAMVLTKVEREQRATVLAKLATLPQIISIPAPILSGYLYEQLGFQFLLYIRILMILLTVLIISRIKDDSDP